jgi:NitT/TauT family transport system permease protein
MALQETKTQPMRGLAPVRREARSSAARRRLIVWSGRLVILVVVCGIWELTARLKWMNPVFIGMPSEILLEYVRAMTGPLASVDGVATILATTTGFALATVAGIAMAMVLSQVTILDEMLQPFFTALNSMPRVALAPLFVMWFGIGFESKVALAASLVFFVVLLNTMAGIQGTDRDHVLLARSLGAGSREIFLKIKLPSAIPSIFAGIELGMIYGYLGTVAGEMLAGEAGVGVRLQEFSGLFKTNQFFAMLLMLVTITTVISVALRALRHRLLRWQRIGGAYDQK